MGDERVDHELEGAGLSNQEIRNEGCEGWGAGRQMLQCLRPKSWYHHVIKNTGTCLRVQAGKYKPPMGHGWTQIMGTGGGKVCWTGAKAPRKERVSRGSAASISYNLETACALPLLPPRTAEVCQNPGTFLADVFQSSA